MHTYIYVYMTIENDPRKGISQRKICSKMIFHLWKINKIYIILKKNSIQKILFLGILC